MSILNMEEYKRRLETGNPVTMQELENELKKLYQTQSKVLKEKI